MKEKILEQFNTLFCRQNIIPEIEAQNEIYNFIENALTQQEKGIEKAFNNVAESYILESYVGAGKIILNKQQFITLVFENLNDKNLITNHKEI